MKQVIRIRTCELLDSEIKSILKLKLLERVLSKRDMRKIRKLIRANPVRIKKVDFTSIEKKKDFDYLLDQEFGLFEIAYCGALVQRCYAAKCVRLIKEM